ncbi:MAG: hypothetical protein JXR29_04520 [Methylothermaceae bacterium]|nr:hypothetical protein [Methylothermaceae bacterium]
MNEAIQSAAAAILRPLVRFLIGHGWTYGAMAEMLKVLCVEEAGRQQDPTAAALTDSKVSLLSGVHRKEVSRIRQELAAGGSEELPLRHGVNVAAQLVALWVSRPDCQDEQGQPLALPLRADKGPSVEALARQIKADMRPRTILDELVRAGIAEEQAGLVQLQRTSYVSNVPADRLGFMGANVGDHLASAVRNLETDPPPFLEQAVYFDALPQAVLEQVREALRERGMTMIRDVHREVSELEEQSREAPSHRLRMGVYYYEEPLGDSPAEDDSSATGAAHE